MATFIGTNRITGNVGEDEFIGCLEKSFPDNYIIYRNKVFLDREADVVLIDPSFGAIVFEVKGWRESTILGIRNGDRIIIRGTEKEQKPQVQAREAKFDLINLFETNNQKDVTVMDMVVYTQISKKAFDNIGLGAIKNEIYTVLKDDIESAESLQKKINTAEQVYIIQKKKDLSPEKIRNIRKLLEGKDPGPIEIAKNNSDEKATDDGEKETAVSVKDAEAPDTVVTPVTTEGKEVSATAGNEEKKPAGRSEKIIVAVLCIAVILLSIFLLVNMSRKESSGSEITFTYVENEPVFEEGPAEITGKVISFTYDEASQAKIFTIATEEGNIRGYIAPKTAGIPYIEEGKTYTFTGTVKEYEGAPEIVVEKVLTEISAEKPPAE